MFNKIITKINEFYCKNGDRPTRIILGRKEYFECQSSPKAHVYFNNFFESDKEEQILGMKVTRSRRLNYLRVFSPAPKRKRYLKYICGTFI